MSTESLGEPSEDTPNTWIKLRRSEKDLALECKVNFNESLSRVDYPNSYKRRVQHQR